MGGWGIDRLLALGGLVVAICGCGLAYYFYRKSIRTKLLVIGYTMPVPLAVFDPTIILPEIAKQRRSFVLLWNKGSAPIVEADFTRPILIDSTQDVGEISVFDKNAASALHINVKTKEIGVKLLRPNEAAIVEIVAPSREALSISVEMVSADMSIFFQRNRLLYKSIEFLMAAGIAIPPTVALVALVLLYLPEEMQGSVLAVPYVMLIGLAGVAYNNWVPRIQKSVTPSVVWRFFMMREVADTARNAAVNLENTFTWYQRRNN